MDKLFYVNSNKNRKYPENLRQITQSSVFKIFKYAKCKKKEDLCHNLVEIMLKLGLR